MAAGITGWTSCTPKACQAQIDRFGVAPRANLIGYRYNLVVDGWGAVNRQAILMCKGVVTLRAALFAEFYHRWRLPPPWPLQWQRQSSASRPRGSSLPTLYMWADMRPGRGAGS